MVSVSERPRHYIRPSHLSHIPLPHPIICHHISPTLHLLLRGVGHAAIRLVLLLDAGSPIERLAGSGLLVLLDQIAAAAAACGGEIDEAGTLEVVPLADLGALHGDGDAGQTDAADCPEHEAGGVDRLVGAHITIASDTVMRLAESQARDATGDGASVDGVEAAEEAVHPRAAAGLGVDMLRWLSEDLVELALPLLKITIIDGSILDRCRLDGGLLRGGHCE